MNRCRDLNAVLPFPLVYRRNLGYRSIHMDRTRFPALSPTLPTHKDLKGMHEEAEALVSRSLLQTVDGGYRVHDLLLDYATVRIKGDPEAIRNTTVRQAKYLVQIRALEGRRWKKELNDAEILRHLKQCRLVDELSGDPELFFNAVKACMGPGKTEEETSRDEAYCCDHAADLYESLVSHTHDFLFSLLLDYFVSKHDQQSTN